jgi:hypothetical protein
MRRITLLVALALALPPVVVQAQPHLIVGGGITTPSGDFKDSANTGYHLRVGVEIGLPTLPVSLRADGNYHRLGEANATFEATSILGGAVSAVFALPGVGLVPYLLGGVGRYRTDQGLVGSSVTDTRSGFHAGFGINLGAVGFVEIRYVRIDGDPGDTKYIPMTIGFRL